GCDALANRVCEIIDVQRSEVLRPIREPEVAERPAQRIRLAREWPVLDGGKPRALWQQLAAGDAHREGRVLALQEAHDRIDRLYVAVTMVEQRGDRGRRPLVGFFRTREKLDKDGVDTVTTEHAQEQLDRR